jgi:hypothetical protein
MLSDMNIQTYPLHKIIASLVLSYTVTFSGPSLAIIYPREIARSASIHPPIPVVFKTYQPSMSAHLYFILIT